MTNRSRPVRGLAGLAVIALVAGLLAIPVLAADPSSSPSAGVASPTSTTTVATPSTTPTKAPKPAKTAKPAKAPEVGVTLSGTVATRTDAEGETEYTLTTGTTVRVLEAGPPWFFGDAYPLKPYVGKKVTIVGTQRATDGEVDVTSVDGKILREPGKPPWAGGWKVVGKVHPGWSQEKWDRWQAKQAGKAKPDKAAESDEPETETKPD